MIAICMQAIAYEACKEIIEVMRGKQPLIIQTLDKFATELGTRFSTIPDERLLAVIYALQMRTYRAPESSGSSIPEHLLREIASVCKACGGKDGATSSPGSHPQSQTQSNRYQYQLARDLDPQSSNAPKTLGELGQRLKGWRLLMESMVDLHTLVIKLEDASDKLMEMPLEELEMPCQAPTCPDGPDTVFIERLGADVDVVRRACSSSRRFSIIGSDGQKRTFLLQQVNQQLAPPQSEERIWQLLRASNSVLSMHPESRRRGLSFHAPRTAAVLPSGRLIEDDPSSVVYIDAYETYCARYGREPDAAVLYFKSACSKIEEDDLTARREAYDYITNEMVTENVFSQYIYKTQIENSRVAWVFKRQFTLSTALSAVACYSLRLTGRSPSKMLVSKSKGELMNTDLTTHYNDRLLLEDRLQREKVPFRLTRNMMAFIGKQGFEGAFVGAAVAAAQGLQQERSPLPSMLALFFRDDILSFAQRRLQLRSVAAVSVPINAQSLETATINNLNNCMHRLENMGPRSSVTPPTLHGSIDIANPQSGMRKLIDEAVDPNNLCQMEPLWQPWL